MTLCVKHIFLLIAIVATKVCAFDDDNGHDPISKSHRFTKWSFENNQEFPTFPTILPQDGAAPDPPFLEEPRNIGSSPDIPRADGGRSGLPAFLRGPPSAESSRQSSVSHGTSSEADQWSSLRIDFEYWFRRLPPELGRFLLIILFVAMAACAGCCCFLPYFCCLEHMILSKANDHSIYLPNNDTKEGTNITTESTDESTRIETENEDDAELMIYNA